MHDIIIVGAGTAGSVLAERLTANGRNKVLLIEAGGRPTLPVRIPAAMPKLFKGRHDWAYETEPQTACDGRVVFTPRGRMLGGSANMNAQIHQWGHPLDFDGWAEGGARGWAWRDVAPVFRAMEAFRGPCGGRARGRAGQMRVERLPKIKPLTQAFVDAAAATGLTRMADYNGGAFEGVAISQVAHHRGARFSAYDAFLKPALRRRNLTVVTGMQATRLLFQGRQVVGVAVTGRAGERVCLAPRVVVATGAIGTPHLLLHSGIGPANQLMSLGVRPLVNAPELGENLHDHPMAVLTFGTTSRDTLLGADRPSELFKWLLLRRGALATNGVEGLAFAKSGRSAAPEIELLFAPFEWRNQALEAPRSHAYSVGVGVLAPKSRGRVRLKSRGPLDAPSIDFGLLSDPDGRDASVLVEGLRLVRRIAASDPLRSLTTGDMDQAESDDDLLALGKANLQTIYHPAGSCRMGDDPAAPVTSDLRLRGVDGVWIADASVMPTAPRAHPNATVAMIAHRAAERILEAA